MKDDENGCCFCDISSENTSISGILTTVVNFFTKTDADVVTVDPGEVENCTKFGGFVCDVEGASFKCLEGELVCDNVQNGIIEGIKGRSRE